MFCVMNIQKRKRNDISGIQKEATRTATDYNNQVKPGMDALRQPDKQQQNCRKRLNNCRQTVNGIMIV